MEAYDAELVPPPFGQQNSGAVCYFNSLWQMLIGLTAFTSTVLKHQDYMRQTSTGTAVLNFVFEYMAAVSVANLSAAERAESQPVKVPTTETTKILHALIQDLAARRPSVRFGSGQESASEALHLLLDMIEPPGTTLDSERPVTQLFSHRYLCDLRCLTCNDVVSSMSDYAVNFNLFHMDRRPPTSPEEFSKQLRIIVEPVSGYRCPNCKIETSGARISTLMMVPEILFCMFNLYEGFGGAHRARYFPTSLQIPARTGGDFNYQLVGQVEHSGGLHGGHYWARGLRKNIAGPSVFMLNDMGVSQSNFMSTPNTYIVAYHYTGPSPMQISIPICQGGAALA